MSPTGQIIVSVIGTACGLLAVWAAWRASPSRDEIEPDMARVERFMARAAQLRARQSEQEIEIHIRIPRAIYDEAQRLGIDLSAEAENTVRSIVADRTGN